MWPLVKRSLTSVCRLCPVGPEGHEEGAGPLVARGHSGTVPPLQGRPRHQEGSEGVDRVSEEKQSLGRNAANSPGKAVST